MHSKTNHPPPQTSSEHQVEAYILPSDILIIILYITTNDKRQLKTYDCVFGSRATMRNLAAKNVSSAPPSDSYNRACDARYKSTNVLLSHELNCTFSYSSSHDHTTCSCIEKSIIKIVNVSFSPDQHGERFPWKYFPPKSYDHAESRRDLVSLLSL